MQSRRIYIKNFLLPCLLFSTAAGIGAGVLIFLFKLCASYVASLSVSIYAVVRARPAFLPLLIGGAATLGLAASLLLKKVPECRGGGIPTAIAILRGLIRFHWLKSVVSVFFSAMLTYLCGVPLGNEGPSVQMGTAVGRGVVLRYPAWNRYIMTGGACAGFAAATGAPLTGIFFAFEEAHRRFSPILFLVASIASLTGSVVMKGLCALADVEYSLFHLEAQTVLPMKYFWTAPIVGVLVGLCAAVFTGAYQKIRRFVKKNLKGVPFPLKITLIFVLVAVIGFFSDACVGSGHSLVEDLIESGEAPLRLLIVFCVRAVLLLLANNVGVTGGLFVPTLAFGAILGSLCGQTLVTTGLLPAEYYGVMVVIGVVSFLGASSRTPLMALTFALEALGGLPNLLPIAISVAAAFLIIETLGAPSFTDTIIESKTEAARGGKSAQVVDLRLTVAPGSFVVGKEIRDILWPPTCMILSVLKPEQDKTGGEVGVAAGDVLHVHYQTYDPERTIDDLEALVGAQEALHPLVHLPDKNRQVPEL